MKLGVQFRGQVISNSQRRWFTHSWNVADHVIWTVVPTSPAVDGLAQIEWKVQVTRQSAQFVKYFIEVCNLTDSPVEIEARYVVLD